MTLDLILTLQYRLELGQVYHHDYPDYKTFFDNFKKQKVNYWEEEYSFQGRNRFTEAVEAIFENVTQDMQKRTISQSRSKELFRNMRECNPVATPVEKGQAYEGWYE